MGKLEEKIFSKIKRRRQVAKENENTNFYSLINIIWLFVTPILVAVLLCKFFVKNTTTASVFIGLSVLCGIYNIVKTIIETYSEKKE